MPLYIGKTRVYDKEVYINHKKLKEELTQAQRFVRGGHPEYKKTCQEIRKKIEINKIFAK